MKQTSTSDLSIKQIYAENTAVEEAILLQELAKEESVKSEFNEMNDTVKRLNGKLLSPSATSIRIIMEHSYRTEHLQEI